MASPAGVQAALAGSAPARTAISLFSLSGHVALVTGGHRSIGLEMVLVLAEAGAVVYCLDLSSEPDGDLLKNTGRLEYIRGNVTDQKAMWARIGICMANAGILQGAKCLEYPAEEFNKVLNVNICGMLYTAQAAGRQLERLRIPGSIVLTASMNGSVANHNQNWVAYNRSKSAVLQMARSLACELAPKGIRVNNVSPGYIFTNLFQDFLDERSGPEVELSAQNPMGRFGRPDELRGVMLWRASDASTFRTGSE
ncbi:hypothetical protein DFH07DRAFT_868582 [Mycena maculata]|uniref:Uncharacterized protein n=1 Tax=Mycena maculata TaxID=230809 RepID=A0AAD7NC02_9AGAR|nr:hypothetical protein DFH07DRAFT_868582 [Mycena maculata]